MPVPDIDVLRDRAAEMKPIQEKLARAASMNEFKELANTLRPLAFEFLALHKKVEDDPDAAAIGEEVAARNKDIKAHLAKLKGGRKTRRARRKTLTRKARRSA